MKPWYERWPELLEDEIKLLRKAGMQVERDVRFFAKGIARLIVRPGRDELPKKLVVTFPDSYPYFRFEIQAPELSLDKHQNPFAKNLCVIGRSTDLWTRGKAIDNTVLAMIEDGVTRVLAANDSRLTPDERPDEEDQGEPVTDYFDYTPGVVLVDGSWCVPCYVNDGTLRVGVRYVKELADIHFIQAAVIELMDDNEKVICRSLPAIHRLFGKSVIAMPWVRGQPPETDDPRAVYEYIRGLAPANAGPVELNGLNIQGYGLLVREEAAVDKHADGWIFSLRVNGSIVGSPRAQKYPRHKQRRKRKSR